MLKSRNWLQIGTLAVFSSAAICYAVLVINLLAQDEMIAKAGIATLTVRILLHPSPSLPFFLANVFFTTVQFH